MILKCVIMSAFVSFCMIISSCTIQVDVPNDVLEPLNPAAQQIEEQCQALYNFYKKFDDYCALSQGSDAGPQECSLLQDYEQYCEDYIKNTDLDAGR